MPKIVYPTCCGMETHKSLVGVCIVSTNEQVLATVDGEMCAQQAEKFRIIRSHTESLELCKLNLDSLILSTAEKYLPQLNLVMTTPGAQSFAAISIISKSRTTRMQGKRKPPKSAVPGLHYASACTVCSWFIRVKQFPEVRSRYLALKKRRGHKRAIITIAKMLLTAIHNVLKESEPYTPELYRKGDRAPAYHEVSVEEAVYILQQQDYLVTDPPTA